MRKIILCSVLSIFIFLPVIVFSDDALVLKYSTQVEILEKKCVQTVTLVLQINNPKGDKYSSFSIPFSDNLKLKKLTGEIRDSNNTIIRKLINKDISTSSLFDNSTFYSDNFVKKFSLKHNKYPYIIEIEFQNEISPFIQIANWHPTWDTEINTQAADLTIISPVEYKFKTNTINIGEPKITKTDKQEIYIWEGRYTQSKANDIYAPSLKDSLPSVSIVPLYFNYRKSGSFESWNTFGEWELAIDQGLNDLTEKEKAYIDQITQGISNPNELISILYHYLQDNTRYVMVDIDLGGLIPYPASYVCNNRFGDCKALTNYMKAMLAYKGIKSYKVDVQAGKISERIYPDFPSQQFNHVILAVPFPTDTLWLECTSNSLPVNYLGSFTQNRSVLWIEPNNSRLLRTPSLKKKEVTTITCCHFSTIDADQKTKLEASYNLRGNLYESVVAVMKNSSEKDKRDYFNRFISFKNYQTEQYKIITANRDSSFVTFETKGSCNSPFQSVGEYIKIELPPMSLPDFEKVKDRESPVKIYMPLAQIDTVYYDLGTTTVELKTEKKVLVESIYGKLEMDLLVEDSHLKIIRKYGIPVQEILLSQYKSFYDFINQVTNKGGSFFIKIV
jgi:hypothetical protein